jgi:hypothetical protein
MVDWAAAVGVELDPYGVDIAPELVDRARRDHPSYASHFLVGDALTWSAEAQVERAGFVVAGRTRQPTRGGRARGFPSVWVQA